MHTTENNQSATLGHILDVPFVKCFNLRYVHNSSRATSLNMPSSNNNKMERIDYLAFSTFLTPAIMMDIFRQSDVTVLRSPKQQRKLWFIKNDTLKHPSDYQHIAHVNETASSECQVFTVRILNRMKSVNITVFVVPHDVFAAILPKHHCLNHVYSGEDAAMLHRDVIKIGKQIPCIV